MTQILLHSVVKGDETQGTNLESLIGREATFKSSRCVRVFKCRALIRGMHKTSNADWWDARVTWQLTPLSL